MTGPWASMASAGLAALLGITAGGELRPCPEAVMSDPDRIEVESEHAFVAPNDLLDPYADEPQETRVHLATDHALPPNGLLDPFAFVTWVDELDDPFTAGPPAAR